MDVLGIVALKGIDVEYCSDRASVRSGLALNADVEFSAVGGVSVTGEDSRGIGFSGVGAYETFGNLCGNIREP